MLFENKDVGKEIYDLAVKLYPINRSIMGEGNRETLRIIRDIIPEMEIKEIPSGTEVFDWTIPDEWEIREAWIKDNQGNTLIDFKEHNLLREKNPERWYVIKEIPKTDRGKINRDNVSNYCLTNAARK